MSIFTKYYNIIEVIFQDEKECKIINIIIEQMKHQHTNTPLIEQTYLAKRVNCDKKTIQRKLNKLECEGWIEKRRVKNKQGYFTTEVKVTKKFKELLKDIEKMETNYVKKKIEKKVEGIVLANGLEGELSTENVNF